MTPKIYMDMSQSTEKGPSMGSGKKRISGCCIRV